MNVKSRLSFLSLFLLPSFIINGTSGPISAQTVEFLALMTAVFCNNDLSYKRQGSDRWTNLFERSEVSWGHKEAGVAMFEIKFKDIPSFVISDNDGERNYNRSIYASAKFIFIFNICQWITYLLETCLDLFSCFFLFSFCSRLVLLAF